MKGQSPEALSILPQVGRAHDHVVDDRREAGGGVGLGEQALVAHVEVDLARRLVGWFLPLPHVA